MIDKNYCIAFRSGRDYFNGGKSGGLLEIIFNQSLTIRIIPNFEDQHFHYPPDILDLELVHELDRDFRSKNEHRYYQFYTADIVFYVDARKKGKIERLDYSNSKINFVSNPVIYFIDELTYSKLVYEIRDKFPFFPKEKRRGAKIWKTAILKSRTVHLLDKVLPKTEPFLEPKKREILAGSYQNSHIG